MPTDTNSRLREACLQIAKVTLKSPSTDVLETIAEEYFACAKTFERRFEDTNGPSIDVLINAVWFIAESLAHGEVARDIFWFDASVDALIELLVPTRMATARGQQLRKQAEDALRMLNA